MRKMGTRNLRGWALALLSLGMLMGFTALVGSGCQDPPPPPPECQADDDCPAGKACQGGKCIRVRVAAPPPECRTNEDCSDNKVCRGGNCRYECQGDSDCGNNEVCQENRCAPAPCEVQRVHFDFNEYYLTNEAQNVLRQNMECMRENNVANITIEGHCDERGSSEYNLSLGQKRAQSVKKFLSNLGFDKRKIRVISYGEERPLDSSSDESAWAKNRRGETITGE